MSEPIEITIRQWDDDGKRRCDVRCHFFTPGSMGFRCLESLDVPEGIPGPRCPGPGTYVLIEKGRWEKILSHLPKMRKLELWP